MVNFKFPVIPAVRSRIAFSRNIDLVCCEVGPQRAKSIAHGAIAVTYKCWKLSECQTDVSTMAGNCNHSMYSKS